MDAERWSRITAAFDDLCDASTCGRDELLNQLCGNDDEFRREVLALLAADAAGGALDVRLPQLRISVAADWVRDSEAPAVGATIGNWKILSELGRGGMGVVMLAERLDGQFEQRVALKLLKRGMDSEAVLSRFLRERQILARLSHPHIARLLDGGMASDGRPYFVMEFVAGVPLTQYCRDRALGLRARLECVLQICTALQFAHRQLVVHLDIKPSNVIVSDTGEVKLLDFGIARLLGDSSDALITQTRSAAQRPLTPGYASPEQLLGEPLSTATDVHGIGCLLYELLTDRRANSMAPSKARSEAVTGIAPRKLRGDLDTIVLKALKREPERRYPTVEALAEDLRRYLNAQPIAARRDTLHYRASKFIARHPVAVALTALALVALFGTTLFAFSQASSARAEALRAHAMTQYLVDIFSVADPVGTPGGMKLTAREVLDVGAAKLQAQMAQQPQLEASFSVVLAKIYAGLGENERTIALLQRALTLGEGKPSGDISHADLLALMARAQYEKGDYPEAARNSEAAMIEHRDSGAPMTAQLAQDLALQGEIARRLGDFARGEALLDRAIAMSRTARPVVPAQIAGQLNQLAALYGDMGQLDQATRLTDQSLSIFRRLHGENNLNVAENLVNLGVFRMQTGHIAQALPAFDEAIEIYRRLLPNDHPLHALALANEARAFDRLRRYPEADSLYREALAMQQRVLGPLHPDLATTLNNLAVLRMHVDDFSGSANYSRQAMAVWAAQGKPDHPFALISKAHLAAALRESGDLAQAERISREVLAARRRQLGENNRAVASSLDDLGIVLRLSGHPDEALSEQKLAHEMRKALADVPPMETAVANVQYALTESAAGDGVEARADVDAAVRALGTMKASDLEQLASALIAKSRIEIDQHDVADGCASARQALSLRPADDPATGWRHAEAQGVYGECLAAHRDNTAARLQLQSALATLQHVRGANHWMTRSVRARLRSVPRS